MAITDIRGASVSSADPPIATNPNPDLAIKAPVRVATTGANITLSGLQTLDGVALAAGDRVLVKDQTDATTNGLYNAATGPWTRTIDAANNSQWAQGTAVFVNGGTVNGAKLFGVTAADPIVVGTTPLTIAPILDVKAFSDLVGNISISQMNGGINASSTSYWRGDGTWVNAIGYATGNFTPTFTFLTPGDLSMVYTRQHGEYTRIGNDVFFQLSLRGTPTFTTAADQARIGGLPFTAAAESSGDALGNSGYACVVGLGSNITFSTTAANVRGRVNANGQDITLLEALTGSSETSVGAAAPSGALFVSGSEVVLSINGRYQCVP